LQSRNLRKVFSSFLVLLLVFSMWSPIYGNAATKSESQASHESINQMKKIISSQKGALQKGPVLHRDLEKLTGDEEVSVIVQLNEPPVAMVEGMNKVAGKPFTTTMEKAAKQKVVNQQQIFEKQLGSKGVKAKFGHKYNYAFNGMALKVKASQLDELVTLDGVALIEPDLEVHALGKAVQEDTFKPTMNTSSPHLEVPALWALGYEGQNVKVAVLDTGIDYNHPEFEGVYKGGYNFISQTPTAGYARTRANDNPYETSPLDRAAHMPEFDEDGSSFYTDHGTHVAGTIAAQGKNPYGIKGLAPKVELYAYRVLGAYGSGSFSGIIAGIDKAVAEGMDVINLSLGGGSNSQTSSDSIAINNAMLAGTTAVIANGNDGPERGTIGTPATSAFAISVGNSTVPETMMQGNVNVQVQGSSIKTYSLNLMGWKFGSNPGQLLNGTYDLVAVPRYGAEADYNGLNVTGKVALVSRGDIYFVDKIAAAKKAGAVAIVVHNNGGTNGTGPSDVFLGDTFHYIPTFDMSYTDGSALRTSLASKTATVTFSNFVTGKTAGDEINDSSSRGPANPVFDIKPDVSAPGTNIMSSVPAYKKDFPNANYSESYDRFTGTSMATPHIAGIAALLKSMHPEWTPFDIKVALSNTAKQLDTTKYDVMAQGAGLVQPLKAATAEALAYSLDTTNFSGQEYDNTKGTITFGNVVPGASQTTITKEILVKNLVGNPSNYTVSVQTTKAATGDLAGAKVSVDQSSFTLSGEKLLKVTLTVPAGTGTAGNELLGYVKMTNGTTKLSLPFAANFAPLTGLKDFSADSMHISPNGDGKLDSTTVRYEFHDEQFTTWLELWDAENQDAGDFEDGYLGYLVDDETTSVGPKTVTFDGNVTPWEGDSQVSVQDGVYSLDLTTITEDWTDYATQNWIGPVYVKTTAPTIVASNALAEGTTTTISGSLVDSYVGWKGLVEEVFGEEYDVNENLHVKYELKNSAGVLVESNPITLEADGTFTATLSGLTNGENTLKLIADDAAQNHAEKVIKVITTIPVDPDPNPTPILVPGQGILVKDTEPMANLTFSLHTTGATPVWYDFTTDANGIFTHNLPDGEYNVVGIWQAPTWYPLNQTFTITNGLVDKKPLKINALDYQLPPADQWNVKGNVKDGAAGLANLQFSIRTEDGSNWYSTTTDSLGQFVFNLPNNNYVVEGIWVDSIKKWYELNQSFTVKDGLLEGGTDLLIDVQTATNNNNVTGTLTKGTQSLANLIFSLRTSTGDVQWYNVHTDANGHFGLSLPNGSYTIEGVWDGAIGKWYVLNQEFTVDGMLTLNVDVLQGPPEAQPNVSGVLTKANVALPSITFSIEGVGGNWYDVTTDTDGSFSFKLGDGSYKLHGIWIGSEMKWYELNKVFTVTNGKLVEGDQLLVNIP
jgi:minor extracellular serine protease Vpr